ncbi:MAG: fimbrillin family protein [Mediterranea sp.]|jgi:hypothetical protein|nr:fimbrillin family protein [Mediterranea sp.]
MTKIDLWAAALSLVAITLNASCTQEVSSPNEDYTGKFEIVTFQVGDAPVEAESSTRGARQVPDTVRQDLGDGLALEMVVKEDERNTRSTYTPIRDGIRVLAIVYDTSGGGKNHPVLSKQDLVVSDNKLSVSIPTDMPFIQVLFYTFNSETSCPTVDDIPVGGNVVSGGWWKFSIDSQTNFTPDLMGAKVGNVDGWTFSDLTTGDNRFENTVTFQHAFPKVRVSIESKAGAIEQFQGTLSGASTTASIQTGDVTRYTPNNSSAKVPLNAAATGTTNTLTSDYATFIADNQESSYQLTFSSLTIAGKTKTVAANRFYKYFQPEKSYTINLTIKSQFSGWDGLYYTWGGMQPLDDVTKGYANLSSTSSMYWDNSGENKHLLTNGSPVQGCPTAGQLNRLFQQPNAFYTDTQGPSWQVKGQSVQRVGLWVLKYEYWTVGSEATEVYPTKDANVEAAFALQQATDEIRSSGKYVFLPAAGYVHGEKGLKNYGEFGFYWSNQSANWSGRAWSLRFNIIGNDECAYAIVLLSKQPDKWFANFYKRYCGGCVWNIHNN